MNPYEVLGVSETATDEQVRSAYIKLVKKYHPDRYQDSDLKDLANDKLKQVNEAYDTITNMRKTAPLPKTLIPAADSEVTRAAAPALPPAVIPEITAVVIPAIFRLNSLVCGNA